MKKSQGKAMPATQARYSKEEFAQRGDTLYERDIRPVVEAGNEGRFVVIDIETGAYEIDRDDYTATERLRRRQPDAQIWLLRIGRQATHRIGRG